MQWFLRAVIFVLIYFIVVSGHNEEPSCDISREKTENIADCEKSATITTKDNNDNRTTAVLVVRGRLGNHLWGYLEALALSSAFPGLNVLVTEETVSTLSTYFRHVRLRSVESSTCGWAQHHQEHLDYVDGMVLDWLEAKLGRRIELERGEDGRMLLPAELANMYPPSTNSLIRAKTDFASAFKRRSEERFANDPDYDCNYFWEFYTDDVEHLKDDEWSYSGKHLHLFPGGAIGKLNHLYRRTGVMETFLEDMQLKQEYVNAAEKILLDIKQKHLKKLAKTKKKKKKQKKNEGDNSEVVFVGIHCRRTDYIAYQERMGKITLKPQYYLDAMHLFRENFKNKSKKTVVFVFVSDDMEWGRQRLMTRNKQGDLYLSGAGITDSVSAVGTDLALLSLCNHTILSHGSFSYFAGVFAGGIKIIPEHFKEYNARGTDYEELQDPFEKPLERFHFFEEMTPKADKKNKRTL